MRKITRKPVIPLLTLGAFLLGFACEASAEVKVQLALIIDASSSTEDELPVFVEGIAAGLSVLKTDGSIELTLVQFSAEAAVIFGPEVMASTEARSRAVATALALDPTLTDVPPFNGGTNIEDGFKVTKETLVGSANNDAPLQMINMLTDGHPTSHNHIGLPDINPDARHLRGQTFAKTERDAVIAAGIDTISFEALGSTSEDLDYLKTLTYPGTALIVNDPAEFPTPIQSQGFIVPVASVDAIGTTLISKFAAAGFDFEDLLDYLGWAEEKFGADAGNPDIAGPLADPDYDGFPNVIEYGMGTDPKKSDPWNAPELVLLRPKLILQFYVNPRAGDLAVVIERTDGLRSGDWDAVAKRAPGSSTWIPQQGAPVIMESPQGDRIHVEYTEPDLTSEPQVYLRVRYGF